MSKLFIPAIALGTAMTFVGSVGVASALHKNDVDVVVDGVSTTIAVREDTVAEVLDLEEIAVGEHDVVLPALDTEVTDGMEITVNYARKLVLTLDGQEQEVWTTARSVGEALTFLRLDGEDSRVSASRSTSIGRAGLHLEVHTAKDVTVQVAGQPQQLRIAGTVADVLAELEITPDNDDIVTPAADTLLTDAMSISFVKVEVKDATKTVEVPFESKTVESDEMDKGTSKVTTTGVNGEKVETYTETYHDGTLQTSELKATEVTKEPVTQVTTKGTREVESSSSSSSSSEINLAREAMWTRIAQCESTNNWSINTGNGYYGGLQFNLQTWLSVGGDDFAYYPHQASRAEQITVANRLYEIRGTQPWSCA
ncbi:MAG: transglycosylase family protein [Arachnia sp.]